MKILVSLMLVCAACYLPDHIAAQVTYQRLLDAGKDSGNWLTYSVHTGAGATASSTRLRPRTRQRLNSSGFTRCRPR